MNEDVEIIYFVHDEMNQLEFMEQALIGIANQTIPCKKTCICTSKTQTIIKNMIMGYMDEIIQCPESIESKLASVHKWAYDQSKARFVAICQVDDQPYIHRCEYQKRILLEHNAGICMGGFYFQKDGEVSKIFRDYFRKNDSFGFNVGYPAFWMLDKTKVPTLPISSEFDWIASEAWEWDLFLLITICQMTKPIILRTPVGTYNMHSNNRSNAQKDGIKLQRENQLKEFTKTHKLNTITEVEI